MPVLRPIDRRQCHVQRVKNSPPNLKSNGTIRRKEPSFQSNCSLIFIEFRKMRGLSSKVDVCGGRTSLMEPSSMDVPLFVKVSLLLTDLWLPTRKPVSGRQFHLSRRFPSAVPSRSLSTAVSNARLPHQSRLFIFFWNNFRFINFIYYLIYLIICLIYFNNFFNLFNNF